MLPESPTLNVGSFPVSLPLDCALLSVHPMPVFTAEPLTLCIGLGTYAEEALNKYLLSE